MDTHVECHGNNSLYMRRSWSMSPKHKQSKHSKQSEKHSKVVVEEVDENSLDNQETVPEEHVTATVEEPQEEAEQAANNDNNSTIPQEEQDQQVEILHRKRNSRANQDYVDSDSMPSRKLRRRQHSGLLGEPFGQLQSLFGHVDSLVGGFDSFGSFFSGMGPFSSNGSFFEDFGDNDNVEMYSYSTCQTIGPDGQIREQKTSSKRIGGLKETTRVERDSREGREEASYSREKDGRGREVRQKRDKSGKMWKEDRYYNMTPEEAEHFEKEWSSSAGSRTGRNLRSGSYERPWLSYRSNKTD